MNKKENQSKTEIIKNVEETPSLMFIHSGSQSDF